MTLREGALRLRAALEGADAVLIGASNGLDITEGLNIFASDDAFWARFGELARAHGFRSILEGLFTRFDRPEQRWAFEATLADHACFGYETGPAMRALAALCDGRPTFVITCNMSGRFVRAGFDERRLLETEGTVRLMRCSARCSDDLVGSGEAVAAIIGGMRETGSLEAAPELVPRCPRCGSPLELALDEARMAHPDRQLRERLGELNGFLAEHRTSRIVILDLGIGARNRAIKLPLMRFALSEPQATYVAINRGEPLLPDGIGARGIALDGDITEALVEALS